MNRLSTRMLLAALLLATSVSLMALAFIVSSWFWLLYFLGGAFFYQLLFVNDKHMRKSAESTVIYAVCWTPILVYYLGFAPTASSPEFRYITTRR
jgi:hypothetical protein